jgi:hypothetical protein
VQSDRIPTSDLLGQRRRNDRPQRSAIPATSNCYNDTMSELITIATYPQAMMAHAAKNFLAEHGIRAFVADEHTTDQSWSNFIEAKLQVPTAIVEQARSLLAAVEQK